MRTILLALAFLATAGCSAADDASSEEELKSGKEIAAYGINFGGLPADAYHAQGLAANHLPLARGWWSSIGDMAAYENQVAVAAQANVSITPILFMAAVGGYTPAYRAQWKTIVKTFVTRFGPKGSFWKENPTLPFRPIRAWEIWNEENTPTFWSWSETGTVSPADYYDALLAAHEVLRSVDPNARVIFGGLTNFPAESPHNALDFLAQVTNMPNGDCLYDAVAIHPYADDVQTAVDRVQHTRTRLDGMNMSDVDIWITEIGWSVAGPWETSPAPYTVADEQHQADHVAAFAQAMENHRSEWHIGPTIWFNYMDLATPYEENKWDLHSGFFALDDQGLPTLKRKAWSVAGSFGAKTKKVELPKVRCAK